MSNNGNEKGATQKTRFTPFLKGLTVLVAIVFAAEIVLGILLYNTKQDLDRKIVSLQETDKNVNSDILNLREADRFTGESVAALQQTDVDTTEAITAMLQSAAETQTIVTALQQADVATAETITAMQQTATETQAAVTALQQADATTAETITAMQQTATETQTAVTALQQADATTAETINAIQQTVIETQSAVSALQQAGTVTAETIATLQENVSNTQTAIAALQQTDESTLAAITSLQEVDTATEGTISTLYQNHLDAQTATTEAITALQQADAAAAESISTLRLNTETSNVTTADAITDLQQTDASTQQTIDQLTEYVDECKRRAAINVNVGEVVVFGKYEQDNNPQNGPEGIDWIVLNVEGDTALLISRYILEVVPFAVQQENVTWEHSYLREWLNDTFLKTAFTDKQTDAILTTMVDNGPMTGFKDYKPNGGSSTEDKVFCLSYEEVVKYFGLSKNRICTPTASVQAKGIQSDRKTGAVRWWLRSNGDTEGKNASIYLTGIINSVNVTYRHVGVRPVIRVDFGNEDFSN